MEAYLGQYVTVKMDRPLEATHPRHNFIGGKGVENERRWTLVKVWNYLYFH